LSVHVTWVVVADPSKATIYAVPRGMARLREVFELESAREATDHGVPRVHGFAAELAVYLEEAHEDGRFDELILVAAPTFLHQLRSSLSKAARDALVAEIGKNLISARRETLQEEVLRVL
jgi:protein required for attachment to host cells